MKVGPIHIEKEDGYQQWRVSLTLQHMSYYTRWYSSHLYTKHEAIEKFLVDSVEDITPTARFSHGIDELFEQAEVALLFLEVEENR